MERVRRPSTGISRMAFGLGETVGVDEDAQSVRRVRALPVRMRGQRDESVNGVRDIPQAGTGTCGVPVDEGPPRLVRDHEVPGGQIVVGDDVTALGGDQLLPLRIGRRREVLHGIVEVPDQLGDAGQLPSGLHQREPVGPDHVSRHEGQDLTPLIVNAEWARRRGESHLVQVGKQGMHGGSPRSGGTADGISDANDTITDVAAGQRLFMIVLHRTSVSDQLAVITSLRGMAYPRPRHGQQLISGRLCLLLGEVL